MATRTRAAAFTEALAVIRAHPELTDDELADRIGIHRAETRHVIPQARRQVAADRPESGRVTSHGQWTAEQ
jgi:predicted DNA-binding protein (UPF0251 family)